MCAIEFIPTRANKELTILIATRISQHNNVSAFWP